MPRVIRISMDAIRRLADGGLLVCRAGTIAFMAAIVVIISAGVFWRYVLNDALAWTEEAAKYLLVWLTFAGAPLALRSGGHIAVEVLPGALPPRPRHALRAAILSVIVTVLLVLAQQGWGLAMNARIQTAATFELSLMWVMLAVPLGCAVMILVGIDMLVRALAGFVTGEADLPPSPQGPDGTGAAP